MVVVPAAIRAELRAHAAEEAPNECCGVIVLRDGVAERYVRGRNALASNSHAEAQKVLDNLTPLISVLESRDRSTLQDLQRRVGNAKDK